MSGERARRPAAGRLESALPEVPPETPLVAVPGGPDAGLKGPDALARREPKARSCPFGVCDGTGWIVDYLADRVERHQPAAVLCDEKGPAGSLIEELENRGVRVDTMNAGEMAKACGAFYDAVDQRTVRHLGTNELVTAIRGAVTRPLGDSWAWSRKNSGVDITPLVSCTGALWGLENKVGGGMPLAAFA